MTPLPLLERSRRLRPCAAERHERRAVIHPDDHRATCEKCCLTRQLVRLYPGRECELRTRRHRQRWRITDRQCALPGETRPASDHRCVVDADHRTCRIVGVRRRVTGRLPRRATEMINREIVGVETALHIVADGGICIAEIKPELLFLTTVECRKRDPDARHAFGIALDMIGQGGLVVAVDNAQVGTVFCCLSEGKVAVGQSDQDDCAPDRATHVHARRRRVDGHCLAIGPVIVPPRMRRGRYRDQR